MIPINRVIIAHAGKEKNTYLCCELDCPIYSLLEAISCHKIVP